MREHKEIGSKPVSYYHLPDKNLVIGTTMRAASNSMHTILDRRTTITQERVVQLRDKTPVVIWLRHPFNRFASAYYLFKKNRTIDEFIHHAITIYNTHWIPQTTLHSYKKQFLPTKVLPFSKLTETWEEIVGGSLPHAHESKNRETWGDLLKNVSTGSLLSLNNYYYEDLELYRKCNVYDEIQI